MKWLPAHRFQDRLFFSHQIKSFLSYFHNTLFGCCHRKRNSKIADLSQLGQIVADLIVSIFLFFKPDFCSSSIYAGTNSVGRCGLHWYYTLHIHIPTRTNWFASVCSQEAEVLDEK